MIEKNPFSYKQLNYLLTILSRASNIRILGRDLTCNQARFIVSKSSYYHKRIHVGVSGRIHHVCYNLPILKILLCRMNLKEMSKIVLPLLPMNVTVSMVF